jgi:KDO2-lipid IV(A) lauroyltransferase
VRAGGAAVGCSPRLARRLATPIGDLAYLLNRPARRQVRANLRALLPAAGEPEIARASRGIFRSAALYYVELMTLPHTSAAAMERRVDATGYEWVPRLLAEGKGIILTGIHCGPSELVLQALAGRGVRYTAMVEGLQPVQVNDYFLRVRASLGNRYVAPDLAGVKELIRVLRSGGLVALLVDRDVLGSGIEARFCDRELIAPPGAIELAAVTGAAVLPAAVYWTPTGRYAVTIQPPIYFGRHERKGAALRTAVETLLAHFEPHLRAHPDQWLVLGPYWRR